MKICILEMNCLNSERGNDVILLLGSTGLLGSEIASELKKNDEPFVASGSKEVDLTNRVDTFAYIEYLKPTVIILCAALVGGIYANKRNPSRFLSVNIQIYTNVLDAAAAFEVDKVIFLGSNVIYPSEIKSPIKTDQLLSGFLDEDMQYFAVAKIAGIKLLEAYRNMGFKNWTSVVCSNLYGINDNRDFLSSHVIPSLITRFENAAKQNCHRIEIRGSASSRREFLYAEDAAKAILTVMRNTNLVDKIVNIGSGVSTRIDHLVEIIVELTQFQGTVEFEAQESINPAKILDSSQVMKLGWSPQTTLSDGIMKVYRHWKVMNWI